MIFSGLTSIPIIKYCNSHTNPWRLEIIRSFKLLKVERPSTTAGNTT